MKKNKTPQAPVLHFQQQDIVLSYLLFRKMAKLFNAFYHHIRFAIAELLLKVPTLNVTDICIRLRIEQTLISQHLAIMRRSKVVVATRQGQQVFYRLNTIRLVQLNELLTALHPFYKYPTNINLTDKLYNLYFFHTATDLNHALYHVDRIKIISFLHRKPDCCVQDLYKGLDFGQSFTSQQLRILRLNHLVSCQRKGKFVYYNLNHSLIAAYVKWAYVIFPPDPV